MTLSEHRYTVVFTDNATQDFVGVSLEIRNDGSLFEIKRGDGRSVFLPTANIYTLAEKD